MRILIAAGVTLFLASSGSAMAAECSKGLLWPYVRNPGDCLTEDEIKSGRLGSYTPANGAVTPPATPTQAQPAATPSAPQTATQPPPAPSPAAAVQSSAALSVQPAQAPVTPAAASETCGKGLLWPFVRQDGDCPTAAERKTRGVAVQAKPASEQGNLVSSIFGSSDAAKPAAQPAIQPAAAQPASQPAAAIQPIAQPAAATTSCRKGLFWPFVRDEGDCATAAEIKSGGTRPIATPVKATQSAAAPAVAIPAVAPAPPAAPIPLAVNDTPAVNSESCHKGVFWPFVRDEGDCPTTAQVKSGATRPVATPIKETQSAAAPVTAIPAVAPAPTPAAVNDTP